MRKLPTLLGLAIGLLLLLPPGLSAFKVQPVRLDLKINRGEQRDIELILTGSKGIPTENLLLFPTDLAIKKNGVMVFEKRADARFSAVPWIQAADTSLALQENKSRPFKFRIRIPRDAAPGEYYAIIMFEPKERTNVRVPDKPFQMRVMTRIAVPIIIDVPGRIYRKQGEIQESSAEQSADGKILVKATFRNTGNIHEDVLGTARIKSEDERRSFAEFPLKAANASKESGEAFVMPGDSRDFGGLSTAPLALPAGGYIADVSLDYGEKYSRIRRKIPFRIDKPFIIDLGKTSLLTGDPALIELEAPPGASRAVFVKVTNNGMEPLTVKPESDRAWAVATPSVAILKPGATVTWKITITLPADAGPSAKAMVRLKAGLGKDLEIPIAITLAGKK